MLIAAKFIEGLRGGRFKLTGLPCDKDKEARYDLAQQIHRAQKFDFGEMLLEKRPDLGPGTWGFPDLTADELRMWAEGYIPLPFETCWYEFDLGGVRSGLLIKEEGTKWTVQRLDFVPPNTMLDTGSVVSGSIVYDGIWATADRTEWPISESFKVQLWGNDATLKLLGRNEIFTEKNLAMMIPIAVYLTLMINSKSTEINYVKPSAAENRKRRGAGLAELAPYRIVTIVPERYRYERNEATGEQRRSPRLHWRRTHVRQLADGRKIVIPRCLVGKAELGEVSHEYKIGHH